MVVHTTHVPVKTVFVRYLSKNMFLPEADSGMPMTNSQSTSPMCRAAAPTRYIMRLSTLKSCAVLAAEPKAMPRSRCLYDP